MKVLFLDIDGVLNHVGAMPLGKRRSFDPACCARLERIVAATDASIVVSSTWRKCVSLFVLKTQLASCGMDVSRVVDMTADLGGHRIKDATGRLLERRECVRGVEIDTWLSAHPEVTSFVILDDDADMYPHMARLVQTSWQNGLQDEHVGRAIALLGRKAVAA